MINYKEVLKVLSTIRGQSEEELIAEAVLAQWGDDYERLAAPLRSGDAPSKRQPKTARRVRVRMPTSHYRALAGAMMKGDSTKSYTSTDLYGYAIEVGAYATKAACSSALAAMEKDGWVERNGKIGHAVLWKRRVANPKKWRTLYADSEEVGQKKK